MDTSSEYSTQSKADYRVKLRLCKHNLDVCTSERLKFVLHPRSRIGAKVVIENNVVIYGAKVAKDSVVEERSHLLV